MQIENTNSPFDKKAIYVDVDEDWLDALTAVGALPIVEVHLYKGDTRFSVVVYDDDNRKWSGEWWSNAIASIRCGGLL